VPAKSRPTLTRQRIVEAALALADERGGAALTMRALAGRLQVEAMSLYHHVRNREDLLDGIADLLVATELPMPTARQPWDRALRDFAVGIRRTAQRHPAAFQLVGLRPLRTARALQPVVALLARLEAAGIPAETAVAAYRLAAAYARGFALAEIAGLTLASSPPNVDADAISGPLAVALRRPNDEIFEAGLSIVIDGISRDDRAPG
jgi:AcrR family transcriptional regulator